MIRHRLRQLAALLPVAALAIMLVAPPAGARDEAITPYRPASVRLLPLSPDPALLAAMATFERAVASGDAGAVTDALAERFLLVHGSIDPTVRYRIETVGRDAALGQIGAAMPTPLTADGKPMKPGDAALVKSGLRELAGNLGEAPRWGGEPELPGLFCRNGGYGVDRQALKAMLAPMGDQVLGARIRVARQAVSIRERGEATARVIGRLAAGETVLDYYRFGLEEFEGWTMLRSRDGKIGYAPAEALDAPLNHGICAERGKDGAWRMKALIILTY